MLNEAIMNQPYEKIIWLDELVRALETTEDQTLDVLLSVDDGKTTHPISDVRNYRDQRSLLVESSRDYYLRNIYPDTGLPRYVDNPQSSIRGMRIKRLVEVLRYYQKEKRVVEISVNDGWDCFLLTHIQQLKGHCVLIGNTSMAIDGKDADTQWL